MTEKDMRKLSRADLLQMLIDQSEELQSLRRKYAEAEAALAKRDVVIENAGSIAEAVFELNNIFDVAQASAQQYLDNIQALAQRQETVCTRLEQESQEKAGRLLIETEKRCQRMEADTKVRCAELLTKAKADAQQYWDEVSAKLDAYYEQHVGLRELLAMLAPDRM